jgi:hypothetical protein
MVLSSTHSKAGVHQQVDMGDAELRVLAAALDTKRKQ